MRFGVLGPVTAWADDGTAVRIPDRKVRALLADLLLHAGRPVAVATIIDDLWGDELPVNPRATLQTRVSQLRRALDEAEPGARDLVRTRSPGYLLTVAAEAVDAGRFRSLAARARRTGNPRMRAATLGDALALWRGPAYADVIDEAFARAAIDRLDEERLAVLEAHAEARLDLGEHDELVAELTELVAWYPLRQRLRAVLLRALYRSGRQADALDSYADLRHRLRELGLDPSAELAALHKAILDEDPALASPAADPAARTNLPAALTTLIGRASAIDDVVQRVQHARLVTLTGPGGVGKTSLALAAARREPVDAGGTWLVELAPLDAASTGPAEITAAVVSALNGEVPRDSRALLVLDNCEHVVEAAAEVATTLLRSAPKLRILATSREPLAVAGEQRLPVPPLDVPAATAGIDQAVEHAAVQLFVARATAADPRFRLTPGNAASVVELCRRLDGLPLALELAAGRVPAMDVGDLVARLDDRLRLLATRQRGVPGRQQTLSAVVEWSWDLLGEQERAVLRRLAPHPGGCTLAAAEAVCSGDGVPVGDVADLLGRLVERSLVVRIDGTSGSRYRLLETVRAFCLHQLDAAGETAAVRQRYERYFAGLARHLEPRLYGHRDLFTYLDGLYGDVVASARPAPARTVSPPARRTVHSADGTALAVERYGAGPPIVLVGGALNDRRTFRPLAGRLAGGFTVVTYDRRGRGDSGNTSPYAVEREIEDLAAVIGDVGGSAHALGVSSGAVLAAEAAARGVPVTGLVLVEPPFILDDSRPPVPDDFVPSLEKLVAAGRPGDAMELFLITAVEMPAEVVAPMRTAPMWRDMEVLAPTVPYDMIIMGDFQIPPSWSTSITVPTLVVDGGESRSWRRNAADAVAAALPDGHRSTMDGHPHDVDPDVLGPIVEGFLGS